MGDCGLLLRSRRDVRGRMLLGESHDDGVLGQKRRYGKILVEFV